MKTSRECRQELNKMTQLQLFNDLYRFLGRQLKVSCGSAKQYYLNIVLANVGPPLAQGEKRKMCLDPLLPMYLSLDWEKYLTITRYGISETLKVKIA
jgi:hypothetical protein